METLNRTNKRMHPNCSLGVAARIALEFVVQAKQMATNNYS